ncbi:caspase-6 isoform X4 [Hemicordylus capensis]|uniref:caspase-6 isoform X4 n=1 Tax=Hemicordylus capensis TaxID=884348 RepID=UPI002302E6D7|nr:caspase-6 isoform X4 [Hemicordylus capensis]
MLIGQWGFHMHMRRSLWHCGDWAVGIPYADKEEEPVMVKVSWNATVTGWKMFVNVEERNLYIYKDSSLTELGFEVQCFNDFRAEDVLQTIYNVSAAEHEDADCFMCVFLSHGEGDHIYSYDAKIQIQSLTEMFKGDKCPSLVGKPKIFVIQACRGDKHDDPVLARDAVDSTEESETNEVEMDAASVNTLPAGADFLMCYSVAEGYYSHRETVNGSWYIQDLCEMIRRHGSSLEFMELLTLVNRKVSHRRVDVCKDISAIGKKQIPCFASMLTKKLYFYPKTQ